MTGYVAFDFDGTLVRSNAIKRDCFYETLAGVPGTATVLDALFASGFRGDRHAMFTEVVRRMASAGVTGLPDPAALAAEYGRACLARIAAAPEVPGARDALTRLGSAGARLFLISATPQGPLEEVVAGRDLTRFFDLVLGGPTGKPEHLQRIMKRSGIGAAQIVVVGDGRDDQEAAGVVGCRFIAVTDQPKEPLEGVATSIPDLRGLADLLGIDGPAGAGRARGLP